MKKVKLIFSLLLITMLTALVMTACDGTMSEQIELENWQSQTVTVNLGSAYTLPSTKVTDTAGNEYTATVTVKTKSNVSVTVVSGQFIAEDVNGYVITVSVVISDNDTRTRTITVNVKDDVNPGIVIKEAPQGLVGELYQLPEIIVNDNSGEQIIPVIEVYLVKEDETEELQTLTDNSFTPSVAGNYKIRVYAEDSSENSAESFKFFLIAAIRPEPAVDEVEDFNHPYSIENAINLNGNDTEWLEEYQDETGVVKMGYATEWPSFSFLPRREMADYAGYDYIIIRMYVTDANPLLYLKLGNFTGADTWAIDGQYNIAVGEWKDYIYPIAPFLLSFNKTSDGEYDNERLWGQTASSDEGAIYISSITVAVGQRPAPEANEVESFNHSDSVYNAINLDDNFGAEWLEEFEDETGVVKMSYASEWPAFSFLPRREITDYAGYDYIVIRMYVTAANPLLYLKLGNGTGVDAWALDGQNNIEVGEWKDYIYPIAPFLEVFNKESDGIYDQERLWGQAASDAEGAIYISSITVTAAGRPAPAANEVESYDHPDSVYNALNWNTNSVEWLEEFEDETGVVKMTYSSEWLAWSFLPRQEMSAYEGYDYITIRMYVEDTDNPIKYFILGNDSTIYSDQIDGRGNIASGQWKDYTFDIAPFLEFWHKIYDGDDTNERLWSQATNNNLGAIYISSITVTNNL